MAIAVVSDWLELKLGDVAMETLRAFTGGAFEAGVEWVEDARVAACGAGRGVRSWRVGAECNWVISLQKATEGAELLPLGAFTQISSSGLGVPDTCLSAQPGIRETHS